MKAYDSAYPGSMIEKKHGNYIGRADVPSLLAALQEAIAQRDLRIGDLEAQVKQGDQIIGKLEDKIHGLKKRVAYLEDLDD